MFIDDVQVLFKAGKGGDGRASFFPGKHSGPDGGNGGNGGSVYINVTSDLSLLNQFKGNNKRKADDGERGGANNRFGRNGRDFTVRLPVGSVLNDIDTGEVIELNKIGETILIAKGGFGGPGTKALANPRLTTPKHAEPGKPGQARNLKINLKLIADYGLIGLPNAGKSSILNEVTRANVKVAAYPFTTLEPNLGTFKDTIIADIPGLIEGASTGRGLGIKFLKHIEKVKLLLHCISCESENVEQDYIIIRDELKSFNPALLKKDEIILLTKSDMLSDADLGKKQKKLEKYGKVYLVSILDDRYNPSLLPVFKSHGPQT